MQPHTPWPGVRHLSDSGPTQDITRALASLESKFPAAVIWFGKATRHWWAMAGAGRRAQLLEAESPSALTAALARLGDAGLPTLNSRGPAPTRPQAVLRAGRHSSDRPLETYTWAGSQR